VKRPRRLFTLAMFSTGVVACAAILDINERRIESESDGDAEAGRDVASPDADDAAPPKNDSALDSPIIIDASCSLEACKDAGGVACVEGKGCFFDCDAGTSCLNKVVKCPANEDCRIHCGFDACEGMTCSGGRSCTFDCVGVKGCEKNVTCLSDSCRFRCSGEGSCKENISCSSADTCTFDCLAKDACKTTPPICKAAVCNAACVGFDACEDGLNFNPTQGCSVYCEGTDACEKGAINCGAALDASIVCADFAATCKATVPTCDGGYCKIRCLHVDGCPTYCCAAKTCDVDAARSGVQDVCP
jgi:hypothetical protein